VNSLLNFSRTSRTELGPLDLNKIVRETLTLVEHQFTKAAVRVELNLDVDLPRIKGDSGKLQQVFLNLFLNARDAMETGGRLQVTSSSREGTVRVAVSDSGCGIAVEHLPRIFDPFFTTKGARKGTGLGLSVSYGIVQEHGGDIEVESEPSRGTRFVLSFPEAGRAGVLPGPERAAAATPATVSAVAVAAGPSAPVSVPSVQVAQSDRLIQ
jgi:signal transduction histidine kinase